MTSILPVGAESEPMMLDETMGSPPSAFGGHANDRGANDYRDILQTWLADTKAPYRRTRRTGKHVRLRGDSGSNTL